MIKKKKHEEIMACYSCNLRVMMRGDWSGWRGVQAKPADPSTFRWFCSKEACQTAYRETLQAAIADWQSTENSDE